MSWATAYIAELEECGVVEFRPRGSSMHPLVKDGELVRVRRVDNDTLKIGDIVLCKVHGAVYFHKIKAIETLKGKRFLIGSNKGRINGWTTRVYGKRVPLQREEA
tara:strand:- start:300 stop:614 length:315 start_codon:yes stop_codon:yes gene_type:complete